MKTILTDLQSFGSINYYMSLVKFEHVMFEQYEHYLKGSYSNRYYIAGANGRQVLSIPLVHENRSRTPIKDLKIANTDSWQKVHWRSLTSAYRRSPWFDYYDTELISIYNKKYNYIIDWNFDTFRLVQRWLQMDWKTEVTSDYKKEYNSASFLDQRHHFKPATKPEKSIRYPQVFEEKNNFLANLSILDLLFCEGNNARKLLLDV